MVPVFFAMAQWWQASRSAPAFAYQLAAALGQYTFVFGLSLIGMLAARSLRSRMLVACLPVAYSLLGTLHGVSSTGGVIGTWPGTVEMARVIGVACCVLPIVAVPLLQEASPQPEPPRLTRAIPCLGLIFGAVAIVCVAAAAVTGDALLNGVDRYVLIVAAFLLPTRVTGKRLLLGAGLCLAGLASIQGWLLSPSFDSLPTIDIVSTFAVLLIASSWRSVARFVEELSTRANRLLVATVALNLVDAAMTGFIVLAGRGSELNPLIRVLGLPLGLGVKVVGGTALSYAVYKLRPGALVVPFAMLAGVAAWHLSGLLLLGPH
jgi:hypothetical protein